MELAGMRTDGPFKETLGQYLKRERESRSVSLEELSKATRISRHFLEALEKDDFHASLKPEFILGFLKGYSRHLGLNSDDILKRYSMQRELTLRKEAFRQLPLFPNSKLPEEEVSRLQRIIPGKNRRRSYRGLMVQITILLLAVGLSLYFNHMLKQIEYQEKMKKEKEDLPKNVERGTSTDGRNALHSPGFEKISVPPGEPNRHFDRNSKTVQSGGSAYGGVDKEGKKDKIEKETSEKPALPGKINGAKG